MAVVGPATRASARKHHLHTRPYATCSAAGMPAKVHSRNPLPGKKALTVGEQKHRSIYSRKQRYRAQQAQLLCQRHSVVASVQGVTRFAFSLALSPTGEEALLRTKGAFVHNCPTFNSEKRVLALVSEPPAVLRTWSVPGSTTPPYKVRNCLKSKVRPPCISQSRNPSTPSKESFFTERIGGTSHTNVLTARRFVSTGCSARKRYSEHAEQTRVVLKCIPASQVL